MIIGVDAGALGISDDRLKAGVYYVSLYLLKELAKLDRKNIYYLYSFQPIPQKILSQFPKKSKNIVIPAKGWLYLSLPLQFLFKKPDVFLALSQAMPWYHPFKTIGFVHGMDFSKKFHVYGKNLVKLEKYTQYLSLHADRIITTSEFLKKSIIKKYHNKNVTTVPLGVDKTFLKKTKPFTLDHPYFLFVGSIKPSKNIPVLLLAFKKFLEKVKKPYYLVCVGSTYWVDNQVEKTITKLHLQESVVFKDSLPQKSLPSYYKGAVAFVSPSLYEGFGLPFVEAMSSKCPVIGSIVGGIPEIVGDSGILVDPKNTHAIASALHVLAVDTKKRTHYINAGYNQAKKFSWELFAKSVLQEIQNI